MFPGNAVSFFKHRHYTWIDEKFEMRQKELPMSQPIDSRVVQYATRQKYTDELAVLVSNWLTRRVWRGIHVDHARHGHEQDIEVCEQQQSEKDGAAGRRRETRNPRQWLRRPRQMPLSRRRGPAVDRTPISPSSHLRVVNFINICHITMYCALHIIARAPPKTRRPRKRLQAAE